MVGASCPSMYQHACIPAYYNAAAHASSAAWPRPAAQNARGEVIAVKSKVLIVRICCTISVPLVNACMSALSVPSQALCVVHHDL